jgi:hypothetical protein
MGYRKADRSQRKRNKEQYKKTGPSQKEKGLLPA